VGMWLPGHRGKPANGQEKIETVVDARLPTGPKGMTQCRCRWTAQNQKVKSPIKPSGRVKTSCHIGESVQAPAGCQVLDERGRQLGGEAGGHILRRQNPWASRRVTPICEKSSAVD